MVNQDVEGTSFDEVAEMKKSKVDSKKFTTKGAVLSLSWLKLLVDELKRHPHPLPVLMQDSSNCNLGGIYLKTKKSRLLWVDEKVASARTDVDSEKAYRATSA